MVQRKNSGLNPHVSNFSKEFWISAGKTTKSKYILYILFRQVGFVLFFFWGGGVNLQVYKMLQCQKM